MPIAFTCPGCAKPYELSDALAGKTGRCKQCGQQFQIPTPRAAPAPPTPRPTPAAPASEPTLRPLGGPATRPSSPGDLLGGTSGSRRRPEPAPSSDDLFGDVGTPPPSRPRRDAARPGGPGELLDEFEEEDLLDEVPLASDAAPRGSRYRTPGAEATTSAKPKPKRKSRSGGGFAIPTNIPLPALILGGGGTLWALFLLVVVLPSMQASGGNNPAPGAPANRPDQAALGGNPAPPGFVPPQPPPGFVPPQPPPGFVPPQPPPGFVVGPAGNAAAPPGVAARAPGDPQLPPDADPVDKALTLLKSGDQFKHLEAVKQLAAMSPVDERRDEVVGALEPVAIGTEHFPAIEAVKALATWKNERAVEILCQVIQRSDNVFARREAEKLLGQFKEASAANVIATRLNDDWPASHEALRSMGELAEPALIPLLTSGDERTRRAACEILRDVGGRATLDAMKKLPADSDPSVRNAARVTMQVLSARVRAQGRADR